MNNPVKKVVLGYRKLRAFTMLARDLDRVNEVFNLVDSVVDESAVEASYLHHLTHEQGRRALEERPRVGRIDLSLLRALPEGTLGHAYADHMIANGLDPATMPMREASTPRAYIVPHLYETHDIWHVVTGLGTDVPGELGLQAFYAAQSPSQAPLAIMVAGLLNTLVFSIDKKDERLEAIAKGWIIGRHARPLFGVRWGELWAHRIEDVRRQFEIDIQAAELALQGRARETP